MARSPAQERGTGHEGEGGRVDQDGYVNQGDNINQGGYPNHARGEPLRPQLLLRTARSHLFRGARLRPDQPLRLDTSADAVVLFGDHTTAAAELVRHSRHEFLLHLPHHQTGAGTLLPPTSWLLADTDDQSDEIELRVHAKWTTA